MKQKFSFWLAIGIVIGITIGTAFNNIGAGMCLGVGISAIITLLLNEYSGDRA